MIQYNRQAFDSNLSYSLLAGHYSERAMWKSIVMSHSASETKIYMQYVADGGYGFVK